MNWTALGSKMLSAAAYDHSKQILCLRFRNTGDVYFKPGSIAGSVRGRRFFHTIDNDYVHFCPGRLQTEAELIAQRGEK